MAKPTKPRPSICLTSGVRVARPALKPTAK